MGQYTIIGPGIAVGSGAATFDFRFFVPGSCGGKWQ